MAVASFFKNVLGKPAKEAPNKVNQSPELSQRQTVLDPKRLPSQQCAKAYYKFLFVDKTDEALTVPQKLVMESVRDSMSKKELRATAVPRLPSVIPKLLRSLRDPDSSAKDYVEIVNKDPVMCAAVLKLANSVYFNPIGAYIGDIERAIVKLGISGLRSVLSAAVMQPIIQKESAYFSSTGQKLWSHSLNCAVACEIIAKERKLEKFKVYLMGLMHDIGKITLFSELCKQHKLNGDANPTSKAFVPLLKQASPLLSYLIAQDWQLPEEICLALREQIDIEEGKQVSPFGALLFHSNLVTEAYAFIPANKRDALGPVLEEINVPSDIFEKLDQVSTQI